MANAGAFLDLATSTGAKLFKLGAEPLSRSFDFVDPSDLQVFLDLLKTKSKVQGCSRIFTVPVEVDGVTTDHSLLHNYGVFPLASVAFDVATYVNAQSKVAQDSFMLFQCIFASLDTDFLKLVTTEDPLYHIIDTRNPQEPPIPCGALLLKIIIKKAHVDTRGTVSFIRTALSSLDTKMMALDSDISKFNAYVKTQVIALEARGETTTDLLVNVFKGYETAQDSEFALFIKRKKDAYDEGGDITVTSLMDVKTSSRPGCSSKPGVHQPRNKNRSSHSRRKSTSFTLPRRHLRRTNALLRIPAKQSKTRIKNGLGRRSFPRRENLSLRLWMAKTTIWRVSTIPTNGSATPLPNAVRTLLTMGSPRTLMPNNASRKPALLLLLFWLKMTRMRNLMRILIATEIVAREDFIPCSFIFSVGHLSR
jgi:hypothetical protein